MALVDVEDEDAGAAVLRVVPDSGLPDVEQMAFASGGMQVSRGPRREKAREGDHREREPPARHDLLAAIMVMSIHTGMGTWIRCPTRFNWPLSGSMRKM